MTAVTTLASRLHDLLSGRGETVAVAESLTGGLLGAALVAAPGASKTFRGGLIVYATELKTSLAGVSEALLAERGPVDGDVARELAEGARTRCGADWGLAATGVAGPEPLGGQQPGTVWIGLVGPGESTAHRLTIDGDRAAVTRGAVSGALSLLVAAVERAR